ncbi:arginine methyltransferase-interacting ring finger protein [Grosmannia clavigera kw1407]|uniref:Arginine methyltransferase-interacting ring finger protein n=1 Tax=Grosmannia clavigera (strain kw1407 / UAMH 11150) TaxID=655863 RepID=F0XCN5_GROCL|nr:arginine methyltransferase-interacting ring finger protein [Grosmannia clavigera kw1407]EFX03670.1 arginine methyltransferase-interacting ring finger protein [Grosmannia clavigera kw1407]
MTETKVQLTRGHDLPPQKSGTEANAGVDMSNINAMVPKQGAELTVKKFNIEWKFPPLPHLQRACTEEAGLAGIETWFLSFIQLNYHGWRVLSSHESFLLEAFGITMNRWPSDEWDGRPSKSRFREILRAFSSREGSSERVKEILRQGLNTPNHPILSIPYPEAQNPEPTMPVREVDELRMYFPGVPEDATFCISCSSYGHRAKQCPAKTCKFCGDKSENHLTLGCPKYRICQQHQQPGNDTAVGVDRVPADGKSATEPEPKISCAMCGSWGHSMDKCSQIWCTYLPCPNKARKVRELPVFCYYCGEAAHFGADCVLNYGEHLSGRQYSLQDDMWSSKYSALFIDETSPNFPIVTLDAMGAEVVSAGQEETDAASRQPTPCPKKKRSKKDIDSNGQDRKNQKAAQPKTQTQPKKKTKTGPPGPPKPSDKEKQAQPQSQPQSLPHPQPQSRPQTQTQSQTQAKEKRKKPRAKKHERQAVATIEK